MLAELDVPWKREVCYMTARWEYDGTPTLVWINGKRLTLPARPHPGGVCGGELFGGYTGVFKVKRYSSGPIELIIWPLGTAADVFIGNISFTYN